MKNKLKNNSQYMEGLWAANKLTTHIELSEYRSLEVAIESKAKLIEHFEENFGFSRTMENIDSNYAFNLGMYDTLIKALKTKEDG